MRLPRVLIASLLVAGVLSAAVFVIASERTADRIRRKAAEAQAQMQDLARRGGDPSPILAVLGQVKPALDAGEANKAESLLDHALTLLAHESTAHEEGSPLPIFRGKEKTSELFVNPQEVTIAGYDGNAMEPFLSTDGDYLFFNNENDPKANTDLHFARRTGKNSFRYLGPLPGVNSQSLDAVPSVDNAGHFYFTTLRDYDRTRNSIYTGDFDGEKVKNVRPVEGTISPTSPFTVNMDSSISPDGKTLYISRAVVVPGAPAPKKSELMIAEMQNGTFAIKTDSERILRNINTGPLAYAAAISGDGLELYFTRASQSESGREGHPQVRIVVSTRSQENEPFGEPRVLSALSGLVEAPSVSRDGSELFFHKKLGNRYVICRAVRRAAR